jgi:hypothetical protein
VSALLTLLEDTDYSVRLTTIKLLTILLSNRPALLQARERDRQRERERERERECV